MKIFVCYSTRGGYLDADDLQCFARSVPPEFGVFIDLLHNNSSDIQGRIESEIAGCDFFLGLITPAFRKSPWVDEELKLAERYRKQVSYLLPGRPPEMWRTASMGAYWQSLLDARGS